MECQGCAGEFPLTGVTSWLACRSLLRIWDTFSFREKPFDHSAGGHRASTWSVNRFFISVEHEDEIGRFVGAALVLVFVLFTFLASDGE